MAIRRWALFGVILLAAGWGCGQMRCLADWYAHGDKINQLAQEKRERAATTLQASENTAAAAIAEQQIVYRTIYRDVIKYVSKPDRNKCDFDPDAVRMRQRAIDAANNIAGFDVTTMQNK